jgi:hypothetical protein
MVGTRRRGSYQTMSSEGTIICSCGVILSILWCWLASPTLESRGVVFVRQWYNPVVLLGWAVIWAICAVALLRRRKM